MAIQSMSSAIAWGTYHVVKGIIDTSGKNHWNLNEKKKENHLSSLTKL